MKSLSEVFGTIPVPAGKGFWQNLRAFMGPGFLVAVGYMDPGNWATDLAGGASFGYTLLSVILVSSIFAIVLQHLALKLGVASGRDLAQACGDAFSKPVAIFSRGDWVGFGTSIIVWDSHFSRYRHHDFRCFPDLVFPKQRI
jgi:manganese transport protein